MDPNENRMIAHISSNRSTVPVDLNIIIAKTTQTQMHCFREAEASSTVNTTVTRKQLQLTATCILKPIFYQAHNNDKRMNNIIRPIRGV